MKAGTSNSKIIVKEHLVDPPGAWSTVPFHFRSDLTALFEPEQFFNQFYQPGLVADIVRNGESIRTILAKRPRA